MRPFSFFLLLAMLAASSGTRAQEAAQKAAPRQPAIFGLYIGQPAAELAQLQPDRQLPGGFIFSKLPAGDSTYDGYALVVGPTTGLCKLVALGQRLTTAYSGARLRSAFDSLELALRAQYGKAQRFDFLHAGSVSKDEVLWMMTLKNGERTLMTGWLRNKGAKLPAGFTSVLLRAEALDLTTGRVIVTYEFDNFPRCQKEIQAAPGRS